MACSKLAYGCCGFRFFVGKLPIRRITRARRRSARESSSITSPASTDNESLPLRIRSLESGATRQGLGTDPVSDHLVSRDLTAGNLLSPCYLLWLKIDLWRGQEEAYDARVRSPSRKFQLKGVDRIEPEQSQEEPREDQCYECEAEVMCEVGIVLVAVAAFVIAGSHRASATPPRPASKVEVPKFEVDPSWPHIRTGGRWAKCPAWRVTRWQHLDLSSPAKCETRS